MKPKNFPARKLMRQIMATHPHHVPFTPEQEAQLEAARAVRTKKRRISVR